MKATKWTITFVILASIACSEEQPAPQPSPDGDVRSRDFTAKVIYGRDDRLDLYQVESPAWRKVASATAALVRNSRLSPRPRSEMDLKISNFGQAYNLCADEPFRDQGTLAFCSGFFVGEDYLVTAGHCVRNQSDCDNTSLLFGFAVDNSGRTPERASTDNVYRCRRIVHTQQTSDDGIDFAVIQLDRNVRGIEPVKLRRSGSVKVGDELVVIGHPAGLPTKFAGNAFVRAVNQGFIVATLDTYGGNSGSAVFNAATGEVEGVLVRGETDFKYRGDCRVSNVCDTAGCRGEDVTRIDQVLPKLPF